MSNLRVCTPSVQVVSQPKRRWVSNNQPLEAKDNIKFESLQGPEFVVSLGFDTYNLNNVTIYLVRLFFVIFASTLYVI